MNDVTTLRSEHTEHTSDAIEALFASAGLTATVVDRCPLPTCEVCAPPAIVRAA